MSRARQQGQHNICMSAHCRCAVLRALDSSPASLESRAEEDLKTQPKTRIPHHNNNKVTATYYVQTDKVILQFLNKQPVKMGSAVAVSAVGDILQ